LNSKGAKIAKDGGDAKGGEGLRGAFSLNGSLKIHFNHGNTENFNIK
jgi:hypothetical protein